MKDESGGERSTAVPRPRVLALGPCGRESGWLAHAVGVLALAALILAPAARPALAQESLCAEVQIEIRQELTLERQAFDAHMRIHNGLDTLSLAGVQISVTFTDRYGNSVRASSDPNDKTAAFFIRLSSTTGVDQSGGSWTVRPSSSADIHWLIIPAPGSAGQLPSGTMYLVGARLSYTMGGEEYSVDVAPDYIYVKPLPELTLDYFLTRDVYSDDAFTPEIEPPEPFTLGVRAMNNGHGVARNVRIDSAQPRIVENELGLLIGFSIVGAAVADKPVEPTLLVNFGDIAPDTSVVGRWLMTASLSGRFKDFTATFSHADELGGELTSLIKDVFSHSLVRDVRVDVPGRDAVRDFLANEPEGLRVFESHGVDSTVTDASAGAALQPASSTGSGVTYRLNTGPVQGFVYARVTDPTRGKKQITRALRSDGKNLPGENAWLSRERREGSEWDYYLNLFDVDSPGEYLVTLDEAQLGPLPPVLQFIPDRVTHEGATLGFLVTATDPNGTVPTISADPLPAGATVTAEGPGEAAFSWRPQPGQAQAQPYVITFAASDGELFVSQAVRITVCPAADTDCDGMPDAWELARFGTLARDGTGDFDGDGVSDRDEYAAGTEPAVASGPGVPEIRAPLPGTAVALRQPRLEVSNSSHRPDAQVQYVFEVYADAAMTALLATGRVAEAAEATGWTLPQALEDNRSYHWRVRAHDGALYSEWANGRFFVNTANDAPGPFALSAPAGGGAVSSLAPVLEVTNSTDPDEDPLTYTFRVYGDSGLGSVVAASEPTAAGANGRTAWTVAAALADGGLYYWQVVAEDPQGARRESPVGNFFVDTRNAAPPTPAIVAPAVAAEVPPGSLDLVAGAVADPEGGPVRYYFELDTRATFESPQKQVSGPLSGDTDQVSWRVLGLADDTWYHWRVKACDGIAQSAWAYGRFLVNAENDPPTVPTERNVGGGAWVPTPVPALEANVATDPEGDAVTYRFEVYDSPGLATPLAVGAGPYPEWVVGHPLVNDTWHYWRVRSEDARGATIGWSPAMPFLVLDNHVDDPPSITLLEPVKDLSVSDGTVLVRWDDKDPDSNAHIALFYDASPDHQAPTLIAEGIEEDASGAGDEYAWDVSGLTPGTYHVFARIADGSSAAWARAPGRVTVVAPERGGITVRSTSLPVTTEAGFVATFSVVLDRQPKSNVTIGFSSSDPTEGVVEPASLVFTPANWNVPQSATVTGVNDCAVDGDVQYHVVTAPAVSDDPVFNGVDADDPAFVNRDNDTASSHPYLNVCNYMLISKTRSGRTDYDYTYRVEITNTGQNASNVVATVRSTSPRTLVVDGQVQFGPVASGATVTSQDTFTIRQDRLYPFDPSVLVWEVQAAP